MIIQKYNKSTKLIVIILSFEQTFKNIDDVLYKDDGVDHKLRLSYQDFKGRKK